MNLSKEDKEADVKDHEELYNKRREMFKDCYLKER